MTSWPSRPRAPEALLAHRQWVRDLARRLCADPATAEDLEQQTWLAALQSPPRHNAAPKAWLGTVLRSWLHKARRGEQRRARRERETARGERTPSTAEIVAEAEAHRRVVDAVFALEEPLRTTMLLRFFEDLPVTEVAARTGVPLETARSRVKRAIELLRATLDRSAGGRKAWMAALLPLAQLGTPAAAHLTLVTLLQAIVMNTTHKLLIAGSLLLLGGAAAYLIATQDAPAPAETAAAGKAVVAPGDPVSAPGAARAETATARSAADAELVPVTVSVRTWTDAPIEGAIVEASPPFAGGEGNEYDRPAPAVTARATSDASGSVLFTVLAAGRWNFFASKEGCCRGGAPDVVLRAGSQHEPVVIRLGTSCALEGRVLRADGSTVGGAVVVAIPTSSSLVRPRTVSDGLGHYRLEALRAGPTQIAAALPGGTPSPVDTVLVPEVSQLDLVLRTGGILVGKVTDESGQPIAGARVRAATVRTGYYKPSAAEATSDAQGRYRIDTLGEGLIHEVNAAKEGWVQVQKVSENIDASIPFRDGATWTRDLVLGRGGRLAVTVRGPLGPVAGAQVTVQQAGRGVSRPKATSDAQGQAKFTAVTPGRALVSVRAEGMQQPGFPADWWRMLNDPTAQSPFLVEVRAGAEATLEIELAKSTAIAGRVLGADEQGLEGAQVNFANASDGGAVTGTDGSFRLAGAAAGSVALSVTKENYVPVGTTAAEVPKSGDLTGLVLRMAPAARVHGTVRCTGARLGEAYVQASMVPDREQGGWEEDFRWANSPRRVVAADGGYDLPLPQGQGRFAVRAVAMGHPAVTTPPIAMVTGQDSYQVDLEFEEGHALTGRIVGMANQEGVASARIRAEWLAPGADQARMIHGPDAPPVLGVGDRSGRFVVHNLRPGRWQITADADGFLAESAEVRLPQEGELVIALPAELSLEGVVQYPDGSPVAAAQLMPEPQQGNRDLGIGIDQFTMSAPDGHFKLPRLQPGQYRINVFPPRMGTANFRRTKTGIVAAGTRDLRIVVETGAIISGRVVDGDGKPLAGISVGAHGASDDDRMGVETGPDGTFTLVGLQDGGSYTVTVNSGGGFNSKPYASLQRGFVATGTTGLEFVLRPGLAIDGTVLDGSGNPVSSVEVSAAPIGSSEQYGPMGWTDQQGKFEIRGLQPGHYRLHIPQWFPRGLLLTGGDDVAAGTSGVHLTATEGAKISGIAVDESGAPLATVEVSVDATEAAVHSSTWGRSRADGGFELAGLVPGANYELSARLRGRVPVQLHAVAAGAKDLRLVLSRGLEAQGRLLDGAERPVAGVNLRFVNGNVRLAARTATDGTFTVSGMTPGTYTVEASLGNVERVTVVPCGTLEAGQRGVELHLRQ